MYAFIKGTLAESHPISIIIETNGLGYRVLIPTSVYSQLPIVGSQLLIHTSLVIREFSQTLYGFLTAQDRDLFEALMGVSGIGPKLALSIIGHLSLSELCSSITNKDITLICKVPGIGKKTAERLFVEMGDKTPSLFPKHFSQHSIHSQSDIRSQKVSDAMSALIHLGYNQMTAQKAIKKTLSDYSEEIDLPSLITHALKNV